MTATDAPPNRTGTVAGHPFPHRFPPRINEMDAMQC